jgi:outer membrane biosynthesis protein TonB
MQCRCAAAVLLAACGAGNSASAPVTPPQPAAPVETRCAAGTHLDTGGACVADVVAAPAPPSTADPASAPPARSGAGVDALAAEQIRAVADANHAALQTCFAPAAQKDPTLRGIVTVALTVDEMGNVTSTALSDSTLRNDDGQRSDAVEACVVRQVRGWRFPPSAGDTETTLPFPFGTPRKPWEGDRTSVNGRLPPEAIKHVIRSNFGRFRQCYEDGLRRHPKLSGRVQVKFVIDRSGAVASSIDDGSDLPDTAAVACVVRAFGALQFPQPEGGLVTVVYPIVFNPND